MTRKADFNAEEWSLVLEGPPLAGMAVITAQRGGTLRESISMGQAYAEARQERGTSELLDAIVSDNPGFDRSRYSSVEELRSQGMQRLRDAVQLLEQKATADEVDGYRRFVVEVAERAANAHREGGFLGIGGKRVSDSEQAALDEVRASLGVDQPTADEPPAA